ncbi:MAG: hypothetical protein ACRCTA_03975 [Bacilli bacterium]
MESNVIIGAHASILGDITIGHNAKIGSHSLVLKDVLPNTTMVAQQAHIK